MFKIIVRACIAFICVGLFIYGCSTHNPKVRDALNTAMQKTGGAMAAPAQGPQLAQGAWTTLEPGLDAGLFRAPGAGAEIVVVRMDTARLDLDILAASEHNGAFHTAAQWAGGQNLVAAVNAGMYLDDTRGTSVGYMKRAGNVLSARDPADYKAALAFGPRDPALPPVQIIDMQCHDYAALREQYDNVIQSIRMIDCNGNNVWQPSDKRHTQAAAATDRSGRMLFAYVDEPLSTYDFIQALLALPLDIQSAMYLEGGPPTQLFVSAGSNTLSRSGLFNNTDALPLPNVIGAKRK
jgi:uncharacterized protein YigE (DUF2233 family)